uniref:LPS assembly protein LptD n=1 Tax=Yoonia rhodophyticola TaxID=3137370 RepID=A0AAN0M6Z9_9RHOB
MAELRYEKRLQPEFGGTLTLEASVDTAYRYSDDDGDRGRDVTRAGGRVNWRDDWLVGAGFVAELQGQLRGDLYHVQDDSSFVESELRVVPSVSATLRWPWAMTTASGTSHVIEPTVFAAWSDRFGGTSPNEDSTRNEFDRANLFALSRFAGDDAVETGRQVAAGLRWTRFGAGGITSTLTFGRIAKSQADPEFTPSSGLRGTASNWLVSSQISAPGGFILDTRALFDDQAEVNRAAGIVAWQNREISLSAAYIWQAADPEENRNDTVSEWTIDAGFKLNETWSVEMDARYDIAADRPVRGGIGIQWRNECVTIDVSASRRYTSSPNVAPTTTYGLSGSLSGFSAGRSGGGPAARCAQ